MRRIVLAAATGLALLTLAGNAAAAIMWAAGVQDLNTAAGPKLTTPPPQPGPSTRPPAGGNISNHTSSGDVPVPSFTGVEVEADITHEGDSGAILNSNVNTMRVRRRREFTVKEETRVRLHAAISGELEYSTGANGMVRLHTDIARSLVKPVVGFPIFEFDGKKLGVVSAGANVAATSRRDFRGRSGVRVLTPRTYEASSDLELEFVHRDATVSHRYLDPDIGPDGLLVKDDKLGLEMVLRELPAREKVEDSRRDTTFGSANNPSVSYSAVTGTLSFEDAVVNLADRSGGFTGAVDSLFAADPLIGATISVSDLDFVGIESDGRARFGGGTVTVADSSNVYLTASFSSFHVGDTTLDTIINTFGILETIDFDSHGLDSPLLRSLYESSKTSSVLQTTDFYFVSEENLLAKTAGFTVDASIDADYFVGGSLDVPEPASAMLLAAGLAPLWARARKRRARGVSDERGACRVFRIGGSRAEPAPTSRARRGGRRGPRCGRGACCG